MLGDAGGDGSDEAFEAAGGETGGLLLVEAPAVAVMRQQVGDLQIAVERRDDQRQVWKAPAQLALKETVGLAAAGDPDGRAEAVDGEAQRGGTPRRTELVSVDWSGPD